MPKPKKIMSQPFFDLLVTAGVIPETIRPNVRRVVIDAEAGAPLRIYYDTFADERLTRFGPKPIAKVTTPAEQHF